MSEIAAVLRIRAGVAAFWCLGCDSLHQVRIEGRHAWGYNGDPVKPTFTPSVKVTWPAHPEADERFKEWRTERICHSFVKDGNIQFLSDCTHSLAGKTVPLLPFPEGYE